MNGIPSNGRMPLRKKIWFRENLHAKLFNYQRNVKQRQWQIVIYFALTKHYRRLPYTPSDGLFISKVMLSVNRQTFYGMDIKLKLAVEVETAYRRLNI